ncbi:uncharacterized protein ATC70_013538 [Mucor velutinosus]|uniref:Reverse transcriptase zinc-binding domain-containing protein n=1 Tax=Mucor velutinosus TaxID=708070 RepID=A0AAN7D592_9FUNG|nr:hypothetical protein ATC70_013538 [Mucor velutinosus]
MLCVPLKVLLYGSFLLLLDRLWPSLTKNAPPCWRASLPPSSPIASFSHWYITTDPRSKATMAQIKLGALRCYWHPSFDLLRGPALPPQYRPPHLLIPPPPRLWRDFWPLCFPAKAFTPWWRLLHGHLSVQARLHIINRARHPSPLCKLCTEAPEDECYLVVGCDMKSLFWFEVISHLGLSDLFPTDNAIWIGLSTLHDQEKKSSGYFRLGTSWSCFLFSMAASLELFS